MFRNNKNLMSIHVQMYTFGIIKENCFKEEHTVI